MLLALIVLCGVFIGIVSMIGSYNGINIDIDIDIDIVIGGGSVIGIVRVGVSVVASCIVSVCARDRVMCSVAGIVIGMMYVSVCVSVRVNVIVSNIIIVIWCC